MNMANSESQSPLERLIKELSANLTVKNHDSFRMGALSAMQASFQEIRKDSYQYATHGLLFGRWEEIVSADVNHALLKIKSGETVTPWRFEKLVRFKPLLHPEFVMNKV